MWQGLKNTAAYLFALRFFPVTWRIPMYAILGILAGLFLLVLRVSEAHSYLLDNPRTCINCHVMVPAYATWERSSHARAATCSDCHVPKYGLREYEFKARDGLRHSVIFTMRREPQVMEISPAGREAVHENCIRCHARTMARLQPHTHDRNCLDCHRDVPHGDVRGLTATPDVRFPRLPPVMGRQ